MFYLVRFACLVCISILLTLPVQAQKLGNIIFLVDESGSVRIIQNGLKKNISAIVGELENADIDWRIGIGGFGGKRNNPRIIQSFTDNPVAVENALGQLTVDGN